jgi:hypothetical protein
MSRVIGPPPCPFVRYAMARSDVLMRGVSRVISAFSFLERDHAASTAAFKSAEIAARLYISTKTAGQHVSNILMKTGLKSRGEAAAWALRRGGGCIGPEVIGVKRAARLATASENRPHAHLRLRPRL